MKKIKTNKILLTSLLISLLSFSCEVGLGEAIDITAPEVKIISPVVSQSVAKQFIISGVATDDFGLKSVTVDIEGDVLNEKFQWQGSSWQRYENDAWVDYVAATNKGNTKNLEFSIPIDASSAVSGHEYTITTKVSDNYSNEGGKTKDERNVIIDTTEPVVSIIEPVRLNSAADPQFDTYVLKNNSILPKIKNGTFTISGSQKEDTNLDYLIVYLDTETTAIPLLPRTLTYPVANPLVKKTVTGANLRNWSTTITAEDFTDESILAFNRNAADDIKNKGHILRLVTESHDQAGNVEIKSHGWFKFNNGADIPWVSATFGENTLADSKVVAKRVYPRCSLQGQAYDDDGLKEISIKIYEEDGVTEIADYSIKEDKLASEGYPTYKAWSFNALSETKSIVVKVNCTDKNGITGDEVVRYLTISDVNPPNISNLSPANGSAVIGNDSGNFVFTGTVDDDGSIAFVKIARIKSGNDADQMLYFDKDYEAWKKCTSATTPYTDPHGNKVWMLPLSTETTNAENRKVRTWTKTFNIFTDFGINGTEKLTNQRFIILAQDVGESGNIEAYTLQGDIEPPSLTIEKIYLNNDSTSYTLQEEPIELPKPFTRDGNLKITDKIKLSGTWRDNSTDIWSDKTKHGKVEIKIADRPLIPASEYNSKSEVEKAGYISATITVNNNGTWETNYFTPVDSSVSVITASINDWAGNVANASRSYYVNSSTPVLSRIGAETADGSYKAGSDIIITMEFNKAVSFEGGTPVLLLNVKDKDNKPRTAIFDGNSNGTSKHKFKYTVQLYDDVEKLNVTGIQKDGIRWHDDAPAYIENLTIPVEGGLSLGGGRSIVIDTKPPVLESLTAISGAGWNNAGKSIFIQATFSEDIAITPEDLKDLKLKFNNGAVTDTATKTGPRTVLFKYVVKATDQDTDKLQIESVQSSGYTITDVAGNKLTSITTLPNNLPQTDPSVIKIDVHAPSAPTVKNLPSVTGSNTVYADEFKFTIEGSESEIKYTLDGSTWLDYKGEVTVSQNGTYNINSYQVDAAGNKSDESGVQTRILNKNKFISYITAEESDGTYTTDDEITIKLICNENLTIDTTKTDGKSNAYLTLNTSPERYAYYLSGSGTKELKFKYKIQEGDRCDAAAGLTVFDFVSGVKTDTNAGHTVWNKDVESRCELPAGNNLSNNRTINVITGKPLITGVTVDQSRTVPVMKITFSNPVTKKAGKYIKVSQTYEKNSSVVYNAPAVLTKAQYNNFKAVTNVVDTYYEKGVNGLKSDNVTPDLSEKYVLKFNYDGTTTAVREFFRDTKIDSTNNGTILDVFIPIASSKVKIDSTDKRIMLVELSDAYKLPVKGAEYTITVPEDIAVDNQGHVNPLAAGKTYSYQQTFTLNGCENPAIRIDKSECTIKDGVATQPLQAQVKIDCQTPGKTIKYSISTVETETKTIDGTSLPRTKTDRVTPNTAKAPVSINGTYSTDTALYIGDNNKSSGYKITIDAYPEGTDIHAKEIAYRSVVRLQAGTPGASGDAGGFSEAKNMNKVYIRGGDSESGNSTTVGFPLSWNSGDYGKTKMMTQETVKVGKNDVSYWYYVSWNVSVNLYYGFLRGNTGSSDADTMENGPLNWCWASCSWVGRKHLYYLEPGTSFTMVPTDSYNTGGYGYQLKHAEYRPQSTEKDGYGVLVNSIN